MAGVSPGTQDSRGPLTDPVGACCCVTHGGTLFPPLRPEQLCSGDQQGEGPSAAGSGALSQRGGPDPSARCGALIWAPDPDAQHLLSPSQETGPRSPSQPRADTDLLHAAPASPRASQGRSPPLPSGVA